MITFSSGLHLGIMWFMSIIALWGVYELFNVVRLLIAEYQYEKQQEEKPMYIDFSKSADTKEFFDRTYKQW